MNDTAIVLLALVCLVCSLNKTFFRVVAMFLLIGIAMDTYKIIEMLEKQCHPTETVKPEAGQNAQSDK